MQLKQDELKNAAEVIAAMLRDLSSCKGSLQWEILRQVIDGVLWWTSNAHGRDASCPWQSVEASDRIRESEQWPTDLSHDHVVPRSFIRNEIMGLKPACKQPDIVERWLALSRECLLTKQQHDKLKLKRRMPLSWKLGDCLFARYAEMNNPGVSIKLAIGKGGPYSKCVPEGWTVRPDATCTLV